MTLTDTTFSSLFQRQWAVTQSGFIMNFTCLTFVWSTWKVEVLGNPMLIATYCVVYSLFLDLIQCGICPDWKSCSSTATSFPRSLFILCSWPNLAEWNIYQFSYPFAIWMKFINRTATPYNKWANNSIRLLIQGSFLSCSCGHSEGGDSPVRRFFSI